MFVQIRTVSVLMIALIGLAGALPVAGSFLDGRRDPIESGDEWTVMVAESNLVEAHRGTLGFRAWISGTGHDNLLTAEVSEEGTVIQRNRISAKSHSPQSFDAAFSGDGILIAYEDGSSRMFRTYAVSSNDGGSSFSAPVEAGGVGASVAICGQSMVVATRGMRGPTVFVSEGGSPFEDFGLDFSVFTTGVDVAWSSGTLGIAFAGGLRDMATGTLTQKSVYYATVGEGRRVEGPVRVASVRGVARDVRIMDGPDVRISFADETATATTERVFAVSGDSISLVSSAPSPAPSADRDPFDAPAPEAEPKKKWTYLCYMDADNNLQGFALEDLNEMELVGSTAEMNIVVLFDGMSSGDSAAYYVTYDADNATVNSPHIVLTDIDPSFGTELDMGDPQTATSFVEYVYSNYPADRYIWDMWNHGGSWLYGMCSDDTDGTDLTMLDVRNIYETVRSDTGHQILFDVAGYDECLMSDVENDYDEAPYTKYICNSEDSIAGDGWEYDLVLGPVSASPDMSSENAAWCVFDAYVDKYGTSGDMTTMSVINVTMFSSVLCPAINDFAQKAIHVISSVRTVLQNAANDAMDWQGYSHQKDLLDFISRASAFLPAGELETAAQNVISVGTANPAGMQWGDPAWNHALPILIHNQNAGESGVAIYAADPPYDAVYDTMTWKDTNWDEFYWALWGSDGDHPNEEPTVSIASPADGAFVVRGSTVPITGTAADSDGAVASVSFSAANQHFAPATGTASWSASWDTKGWAPGWYKIIARSYDGQDYSEYAVVDVRIILDPTAPDLNLLGSSIAFDDPAPSEGALVLITATTTNANSRTDARTAGDAEHPVQIGFYAGDPADGGMLIGIADTTPSVLPRLASGTASILWNTMGMAGYHDIHCVADPLFTIVELSDANNTGVRPITVDGCNVAVACDANASVVQAGASHSYAVEVTNTGTSTQVVRMTIDNPTDWTANYNNNPNDVGVQDGLDFSSPPQAQAYRSYGSVMAEIDALEADNPDFVDATVIGTSWEGRDIVAVKVSDNVAIDEPEPEVLIMGLHHAQEWMSVEVAMYCLNDLVSKRVVNPQATWMVDNREVYFIPIVNPDGYAYSQDFDSSWRKNRRDNGDGTFGVDLNRNYNGSQNGDPAGEWGGAGASALTGDETYRGPYAFSEPETQAVRDFVLARDLEVSVSYHSAGEEIYWPWGYNTTVQTPDDAAQEAFAQRMALTTGYTPMQSADAYLTTGDSDDWIYGNSHYARGTDTFPFTVELDTWFQPPASEIAATCALNLQSNYFLTEAAGDKDLDAPSITHVPVADTIDTVGPYSVSAVITGANGIPEGATKLMWRSSGAWNEAAMSGIGGTYTASIPGQPDGTLVRYYIQTDDALGQRRTEPRYAPYEMHDFFVGSDRIVYDIVLDPLETRVVNMTVLAPPSALPRETATIRSVATVIADTSKASSVETVTSVIPAILLINDGNLEISQYRTAMDNCGYAYDIGTPTSPLGDYRIVVWATDNYETLSTAEKISLMGFMDAGGSVYINGEDVGYDLEDDDDSALGLGAPPDNFYGTYLHAAYVDDSSASAGVNGVADDPVTDGMSAFDSSGSYQDVVAPRTSESSAIFSYTSGTYIGQAGALKADTDTYRLVYIGFEYFEGTTDPQGNKDLLMDRILKWLNPDNAPSVDLLQPSGADRIFSGTVPITWSVFDDRVLPAGCVDIDRSTDGGVTWSSVATNIDDSGAYSWNTIAQGVPDTPACMVRVTVTDSIGQICSVQSPQCFSIDNVANDRWYLQAESSFLPPTLDLDMKPVEASSQAASVPITATGEVVVGTFASGFRASSGMDASGVWTFNACALTDSAIVAGRLYARVYGDDGTRGLLLRDRPRRRGCLFPPNRARVLVDLRCPRRHGAGCGREGRHRDYAARDRRGFVRFTREHGGCRPPIDGRHLRRLRHDPCKR